MRSDQKLDIDYVGFEPSILYSVAGEILKDDPYELQDDRYKDYDRSFHKTKSLPIPIGWLVHCAIS